MPLSNPVIMSLNDITGMVSDKKNLTDKDTDMIKEEFNKILASGQRYDVDEIESWFENEGSWTHKPTIIRITNISHYVQSRFDQSPKKFKIVSDDECGCH
jgi:hypothetical protein